MAPQSKKDLLAHYKRLLKSSEPGGLEATEEAGSDEPDLSQAAIKDRVDSAAAGLHEVVKQYLGDSPELHEIAAEIMKSNRSTLERLGGDDPETLGADSGFMSSLEVIVRSDGSRPSFMVRQGAVDLKTSPAGSWASQIEASAMSDLPAALSCVGRLDDPASKQGFQGTGFLIQDNLIVTNRHVLQVIADADAGGAWTFHPGVVIDFGHEYRGLDSVTPRAVKQVAFCAPRPIDGRNIDHSKLDLVLIELEAAVQKPRNVLAIDISQDWASPEKAIYTIGYPGDPGRAEPLSLLEKLFQSTFGCKRLAPGEIQPAHSAVSPWTLAHDATTLGGNSGSVVVVAGREGSAAGLHYGGRRLDPRENWGHVLGRVLDQPDQVTTKTLREVLDRFGVNLVDRVVSWSPD
jgi:V8-like Glu-specific endopeptidase